MAFYYAMRDTVVAADLDQASRVAYGNDKRWAKVVTLKVPTFCKILARISPTVRFGRLAQVRHWPFILVVHASREDVSWMPFPSLEQGWLLHSFLPG